jgi:hypothetical protein
MARPVHFRVEGDSSTRSQPTACTQIGFNTPDTDLVTCPLCRGVEIYLLTALRHREVVEALSSPKEEHPCLKQHHSSTTGSSSATR